VSKEKKVNKERDITGQAVEFILSLKTEELKSLTEEKISQTIGIELSDLSPRFKIDQKMTIPGFILREKLYRAYFLIKKGSDKTIDALSRELGFLQVEDFSNEFEKFFAITPDRYRDLTRNVGDLR
jgi:AraC-like DNA-binding protein